MRMLKWINEVVRENNIRKKKVSNNIGVVLIMKKNQYNWLRWFGRVIRRKKQKTIKVVLKTNTERCKGIRRPTKRQLKMT